MTWEFGVPVGQFRLNRAAGRGMVNRMIAPEAAGSKFEGVHCTIEIQHPAKRVVLLTIEGRDAGEHGQAPFEALTKDVTNQTELELFIDARKTHGATIGVSHDWAMWLRKHRDSLRGVTMLTGSRFVQVTAEFVKRFNEMGDQMRITTDPAAFEQALRAATE